MSPLIGEFTGTAFLVLLGTSVVANVLLKNTKGHSSGWLVIAIGWGIAVFVGVYISASSSGAHLNPAVTLALANAGKFEWGQVVGYIMAQFAGAMTGSFLTWLVYRQHFDQTQDVALQLAVFCNAPAIRSTLHNLITEIIATMVLVLGIFFLTSSENSLGSLDALPVALLVTGIGLSLGGPTGYAINPARDLGPRIIHFLLPIKQKGGSDWHYGWIPVVGPLIGGWLASVIWRYFFL